MNRDLMLTLIISLAVSFSCASGHHKPYTVPRKTVRNIKKFESSIKSLVNRSKGLTISEIGTVKYDSFGASIWHVEYHPKEGTAPAPAKKVLINAGIHGNEPAGVEYVLNLLEDLSRDKGPLTKYSIDIIPVVNPWGWSHNIRFNPEGIDINRDFKTLHSSEAKIIVDFLKNKKYDIMIDLHEDPDATGIYIYQYGRKSKDLLTRLVTELRESGYPIEENIKMVILKTKNGIIDAPMWGLKYMKMIGQLSIANYYRLNMCKQVFTVETPVILPLKKRIWVHRRAVEYLIGNYEKQ